MSSASAAMAPSARHLRRCPHARRSITRPRTFARNGRWARAAEIATLSFVRYCTTLWRTTDSM
eukprot:10354460-Lingulodinium_polyedra.AAC.1